MLFADALTLDAPKRTADGYLAVRAKAARTGVYEYSGREVDPTNAHGLRDQATVRVLRDPDTVFDERAVRSFIAKPITDDHPREAVTAANWRDHSRGVVMGAIRDGDHIAFDLVLMDAATIAKVEAGKVELSNGYSSQIEVGDFTAPDGTRCQARQTSITGNHVAIVDRGRAGPSCRIGDAALCDSIPLPPKTEKPVKTMTIDGLTVDVSNADTAEATIKTLIAARDKALTDVATLTTDKATLTAEKAALEQRVKDAALTPQQLRDAAKSYVATVDKAKSLGVTVTDAMDETAIMKAVVDAKLGDAAKGWTDAQVAAGFVTLTKDAKVADTGVRPIAAPAAITNDNASVRDLARAAQY